MKVHGNSHQNKDLHHLYEIRDRELQDTFKYGISSDPLLEDGSSPRASTQVKLFNKVVNWARFFAKVLVTGIPGRKKAEELERTYIEKYEEEHGRPPRGNS